MPIVLFSYCTCNPDNQDNLKDMVDSRYSDLEVRIDDIAGNGHVSLIGRRET
jgi:hypothetical protein